VAVAQAPIAPKFHAFPNASLDLGKADPHIRDLLTAVSSHPTAEAYNIYAREEQLRRAVSAFEQALSLDPVHCCGGLS